MLQPPVAPQLFQSTEGTHGCKATRSFLHTSQPGPPHKGCKAARGHTTSPMPQSLCPPRVSQINARSQSKPLASPQGPHGSLRSTPRRASVSPVLSHLAKGEDGGDGTQGKLQHDQGGHAGSHQRQQPRQHCHVQQLQHPPLRPDRRLLRLPLRVAGDSAGTLSQPGRPRPPPPPRNAVTALVSPPALCSGERRALPLLRPPPAPMGAKTRREWIPKPDPQTKMPQGVEEPVLTSGTGCRDKPSGGCRALRQRRHPPTLRGKGSRGSPVSPRLSPNRPHATAGTLTLQERVQQRPAPRQPRQRRHPGPQRKHFWCQGARHSQAPAPRSMGRRWGGAPPAGKSLPG